MMFFAELYRITFFVFTKMLPSSLPWWLFKGNVCQLLGLACTQRKNECGSGKKKNSLKTDLSEKMFKDVDQESYASNDLMDSHFLREAATMCVVTTLRVVCVVAALRVGNKEERTDKNGGKISRSYQVIDQEQNSINRAHKMVSAKKQTVK